MLTTKFPDLLNHLDAVLRLPSVSSANAAIDMSNSAIIDYLANCFSDLGFEIELVPSAAPGDSRNKKVNMIATLGSGPGGLVLAGHTDTVPLDESLWQVDPFKLTQKDHRLFGLGSTDMKGFFPIIMEAVKELHTESFREPLIVLATADEETSMQGARTLADLGKPKARYAVIGEPTGMKPIRSHKGMMMESIHILGRSGHSSNPALGKNALEAMHGVISELLSFREELQTKYRDPFFAVEVPTLNLGCIHGGDNPNRICGQCLLEFDIRLLPGMDILDLRKEFTHRVQSVADKFKVDIKVNPLFPGVPPFEVAPDSELMKAAEKLTGHSSETVAFGTEGPELQRLGLDTIILGPGDIDMAHQPNEYMSENQVQPCIDLLKKLIVKFCL